MFQEPRGGSLRRFNSFTVACGGIGIFLEEIMDFCFDCYKYDRTENQWERIAKKNNPNFNIPKRFFAIRNIEAILNCVYPANLIPIEFYNAWIETHPNQRIFNDFSLKCALEQGLLSKEFFDELQEKRGDS